MYKEYWLSWIKSKIDCWSNTNDGSRESQLYYNGRITTSLDQHFKYKIAGLQWILSRLNRIAYRNVSVKGLSLWSMLNKHARWHLFFFSFYLMHKSQYPQTWGTRKQSTVARFILQFCVFGMLQRHWHSTLKISLLFNLQK